MYFDINGMYAWAMKQALPLGEIKWIEDVTNLNFNMPDDNPVDYILEVDLYYPQNLHDAHSDLPLAAPKCRPPNSKEETMLVTLWKKADHYRNLKQYVKEGLELTKIHRIKKNS